MKEDIKTLRSALNFQNTRERDRALNRILLGKKPEAFVISGYETGIGEIKDSLISRVFK